MMRRINLNNVIDVCKPEPSTSEWVVIDQSSSSKDGFDLAQVGGFLEAVSPPYYKCKRIVANNLDLSIISEYPLTLK